MKVLVSKLFSEGDYFLKEAKSMFFIQKENHHKASILSCGAVKKYLDAYAAYLFKNTAPSDNYHVLLHQIVEKDTGIKQFTEKIYEVKCFAEESDKKKEEFFLFADEINDVLNIVFNLRNYIAGKVGYSEEFLADYLHSNYMTT